MQSVFSRKLKRLRIARGYTKARHFAAILGVNENTYYRFERGETFPSLSMVQKICTILNVPVSELLPAGTSDAVGNAAIGSYESPNEEIRSTTSDPPGFREGASTAVPGQSEHPVAPSEEFLRCALAAWALAEQFTLRNLDGATVQDDHSVARFTDCADLYRRLKSDPFGTVADFASTTLDRLPHGDRSEVVRLIDDYIAAFRKFAERTLSPM